MINLTTLYHNPLLQRLFPTVIFLLKKELADCETVLDLGCGPSSPIQHAKNIKYSVGVDAHKPYIEASKREGVHNEYHNCRIQDLKFEDGSFDAVVMVEVFEHLDEKTALDVLRLAKKWAKKKVIVTTPNGFIHQKELDTNPYQKHLSGWSVSRLRGLGFKCYGLAGLKVLRAEGEEDTMETSILTSIRFKPKPLWFGVAVLSQFFTFWIPELAFEIFGVAYNDK